MRKFRVAEHFVSVNGESSRAGELACFVRFTRCNLNCSYCDTSWANGPDAACTEMTAQEIGRTVRSTGICNVTLTGGEPLLQEGIEEVLAELLQDPAPNAPAPASPLRVEIETNGSVDISSFIDINGKRPVFTLDYKVPGSGMTDFMNTDNYQYLTPEDAVKFVVSDRADMDHAREIIEKFQLAERCHVYLSPVFDRIRPEEIVEYMMEHRMNGVTLNIQLHKIIWDPDKRGV